MRSSIHLLSSLTLASVGLLGCMPTDISGEMPPIDNIGDCDVKSDYRVTSAAATLNLPTRCFIVTGTLEISNTDLESLEPFALLREASAIEIFDNPQLQTTSGLAHIGVTDKILIKNNRVLHEIVGFETTESVTRLEIANNPALESLSGLQSLIKVGVGGFLFSGNGGPTNLLDLERLERVDGTFEIARNTGMDSAETYNPLDKVKDLIIRNNEGMNTLKADVKTAGNITINDNADLTRFEAFRSLETVAGNLNIEGNGSLTIVNGFTSKFASIAGDLSVINNTALSDTYDLSISLFAVGGSVVITGNTALSDCRASEFDDYIEEIGGIVDIGDNSASFDPCY